MTTKTCAREGCDNPLNTGKYYCSPQCSAMDRVHRRGNGNPIPETVTHTFQHALGENANVLLEEMKAVMLEDGVITAPPLEIRTEGDFMYTYYIAGEDRRPSDALEMEVIREMLKSGIVLFVLEMKLASIMSVFRNDRSWKVVCPDKELSDVAEANLRQIMPRMMLDALRAMLTYGAYFAEKCFEYKTPYQLGLSKSRAASREFAVYKLPAACNPESIDYIKRTSDGSFDGFVQRPKNVFRAKNEIDVQRKSAMVIPYRGQFRNLWGESFLKPLYPIWFWYEIALRSWVRFMERMGTPVAVCYAPSRAKVLKPGTSTAVDAMTWGLAVAGNIAKSNAAVLPSDVHPETKMPLWKLEYMTAEDRGEVFSRAIEMLSQLMLRAGMSADRAFTQGQQTGSYALGEIHEAATQIHNELILIEVLWALNQWFMPDYVTYNRGETGPPMWLETEGLDPREKERLFKIMSIAGNAEGFKDALMMVNWREMYEINNVPTLTEKEIDDLKQKMLDEGLKRQEETMKVQHKFQPKPGEMPKRQETPQQTAAKTETNGDNNKFERLASAILDGSYTPIILSNAEMAMVMRERDPQEVVQLFNPFHDKLGKFASKRGAGGSVVPQKDASPSAGLGGSGSAPKAKAGSFLRTTGTILGIAGLGAILLTVLSANSAYAIKQEDVVSPEEQKEVLDKVENWREGERERVEQILANRKEYDNLDDAIAGIRKALSESGVADIKEDIKMKKKNLNGALGMYDTVTNTLYLDPEFAGTLLAGDPLALAVLAHEMSHSAQFSDRELTEDEKALVRQAGEAIGEDYDDMIRTGLFFIGDEDNVMNHIGLFEGANDLQTLMAISRLTGVPTDSRTIWRAHEALIGADPVWPGRDEPFAGNAGYPAQLKTIATIAEINQRETGESRVEFVNMVQTNGFDGFYWVDTLEALFPERMENYDGEYGIPPYKEINEWMLRDYGIDYWNPYSIGFTDNTEFLRSAHADPYYDPQWDILLDVIEEAMQ